MLHVHKSDTDSDHHHRNLAAHSHQIHVESLSVDSEVKVPDDDSSAVPVVLGQATASHIYYLVAVTLSVVGVEAAVSSRVLQFVVTSRAHGPPAARPCSPRAPPTILL